VVRAADSDEEWEKIIGNFKWIFSENRAAGMPFKPFLFPHEVRLVQEIAEKDENEAKT